MAMVTPAGAVQYLLALQALAALRKETVTTPASVLTEVNGEDIVQLSPTALALMKATSQ